MKNTIIDIRVLITGCGFPKYEGTSLYIKTDSRNILIDTGARGDREVLLNNLKKVNTAPENIDVVLFTHMHIDHVANFELFPNAVFYTTEKEYSDYKKIVNLKKKFSLFESLDYIFSEEEWGLLKNNALLNENKVCIYNSIQPFSENQEKRIKFFKPNDVLLGFIKTIPFKGHSVESVGYLLNWKDKCIVVAGDVLSSKRVYERYSIERSSNKENFKVDFDIESIISCADIVIPGHGNPFEVKNGAICKCFILR